MPQPCAACHSEHRAAVDQKIKSGTTFTDVSLWLGAKGAPISRNALARHAKAHLVVVPRSSGPRPMSEDFATAIRDRAHSRLESGELEPDLSTGLKAQTLIDTRQARTSDHDLMLRLAAILGGVRPPRYLEVRDPETVAIEAEYRKLLEPGQ